MSAFSTPSAAVDTALLTTRLSDAQLALHKLMIGQSATATGHDGKSVAFTPADEPKLRAYIAELQKSLNVSGTRRQARRPFF